MSWQVFILFQTFLTACSIITLRVLARDKKTARASFVINAGVFISLYITFLVLLPLMGHIEGGMWQKYWWRFLGGGLAFTFTNVCTYKTLVYFDAAIASIVGTINALFTIIGSTLLLGEDLSPLQAFGAIILIAAIGCAVIVPRQTGKRINRHSIKLGLMFGVLAGLSFGVAIVNEKSLLGDMTIATYGIYGIGAQAFMAVVAAGVFQFNKLNLLARPKVMGWTVLSGVLRGMAGICFIFSEVRSNNVALVTVISNFRLIIVVMLGYWLLKERQRLVQKLASAVTAVAGLGMLFWR